MLALPQSLDFNLPEHLQLDLPTETRGLARDEVRLLVSDKETDELHHTQFRRIGDFLRAGDVLVVNTSATLMAALDVRLPDGEPGRLHLSTRLDHTEWLVELRRIDGTVTRRYTGGAAGERLALPGGGQVRLEEPHYDASLQPDHLHLWRARFQLPMSVEAYLHHYGRPIQYAHLDRQYPADYYQTIFADQPGSAEMPSAGRAFTADLVTRLIIRGVQFAPLLLHTGVASLESDEQPYAEYFEVPATTAGIVNLARRQGRRVIAVGTTAVRALESAADGQGRVRADKGWTELYITPERGLRVVTGLLTGFHEPNASHLLLLEALAGRRHLVHTYAAALAEEYQWHEFGDLHLIR